MGHKADLEGKCNNLNMLSWKQRHCIQEKIFSKQFKWRRGFRAIVKEFGNFLYKDEVLGQDDILNEERIEITHSNLN